jgi:cell division protein FtsL
MSSNTEEMIAMNSLLSDVQWLLLVLFGVVVMALIVVGAVHARRAAKRRRAAEALRRAERDAAIRQRLQAPPLTAEPAEHAR